MGEGETFDVKKDFFVVQEGVSAVEMNRQLARGKHLLFTPGLYTLSEPLRVTRPGTIVLGLGLATLIPGEGQETAIMVDDVDGVTIASLMFDAHYSSHSLLQVGGEVNATGPSTGKDAATRTAGRACVRHSENPTLLAKAVKNPVEMEHMREAHIRDGVAVTRFMYWLKKRMACYDPEDPVTELSAAERLLELRKEQEHFLDLSFETISAYGPHGAIVHYAPTEASDIPLEARSFLLVDSGGQYLEGTTDITRTFACGPLTQEEKECYTRVLRGNLNLAAARFRSGCTGMAFDYLAREPLWEVGMDYNHGTGHGVGFLLNVHEAPNSFSYKQVQGRRLPCVFEEGMITSDEPGVYLEGKFGVRCENLILCVKDEKNEYGQFMRFETLTMVPWDLDAVDPELLSDREKALLNAYHREVYEKISPYLEGEEKAWLREATREI
jgi:Xaa-Pro aminopeptidase